MGSIAWQRYENYEIDSWDFFEEQKTAGGIPLFATWISDKIKSEGDLKWVMLAKLSKLARALDVEQADRSRSQKIMEIYARIKGNLCDERREHVTTLPIQGTLGTSHFDALPGDLQCLIMGLLDSNAVKNLGKCSRNFHNRWIKLLLNDPKDASDLLQRFCNPEVPELLFTNWLSHTPVDQEITIFALDDIPESRLKKLNESFPQLKVHLRFDHPVAIKKALEICPEKVSAILPTSNCSVVDRTASGESLNRIVQKCQNLKTVLSVSFADVAILSQLKEETSLEWLLIAESIGVSTAARILTLCPKLGKLQIALSGVQRGALRSFPFPATLEELNISGSGQPLFDGEIRDILKRNPNLTKFTADVMAISGEAFIETAEDGTQTEIQPLEHLQSLQLFGEHLDSSFMEMMCKKFPQLEELQLTHLRLRINQSTTSSLATLRQLKSLHLGLCTFDLDGLQTLLTALPTLRSLTLDYAWLLDTITEEAIEGLAVPQSLERFEYSTENHPLQFAIVKRFLSNCPDLKSVKTNLAAEGLARLKQEYPGIEIQAYK